MAWPSDGSYTAWSACFKVTSQASKISAVNSWYFLDLSLMPSAFWSAVQADGDDLRFTEDDGETAVYHRLIYINTGTETGLVAIAQPHGASGASVDVDTFCYVGNSGASSTGSTSVWPSTMTCLYMLQEEPTSAGAILDWTVNARHSTAINGTMTSGDLVAGGPHGGLKGIDFDSNDRAVIPSTIFDDCETSGAYTWFGWVRPTYNTAATGIFGSAGSQIHFTHSDGDHAEAIQRNSANSSQFECQDNTGAEFTLNTWHLFVVRYDGSTLKVYLDGVEQKSVAATSLRSATLSFYIGHDNTSYSRSRLAEIGMYSIALSNDQIATIYANETDSGFWVIVEETGSSGNTGTGAITAPAATVSGSGFQTNDGSGSLSAPAGLVNGSGVSDRVGTGSISAPAATVAGSGIQTVTGTGSLVGYVGEVDGAGTVTVPVFGTGALDSPMPLVSADGDIESGNQDLVGDLIVGAGIVQGTGITSKTGTAALVHPMPIVAGSGKSTISGTGALTAPDGYVIAGSGLLSPPDAVGTAGLVAPAGELSGAGFVLGPSELAVDSIAWYLTGASAAGKSQRDQSFSLGGFRSGVPVKSMTWDCRQPMVGVEILGVGALNGRGTGSLEAITDNSLRWTPPGGVAGTTVTLAHGQEAKLFGFESGAWIHVRRNSTLPMVGIHSVQCIDVYNNAIGLDNVASADAVAGETFYRAIMGKNEFSGPMTDIKIWLDEDANSGIAIGYELAVNDEIQDIADETTAPTGITWVTGTTSATGITIPAVSAGQSFGLWIRKTIAADSAPSPSELVHIHVQFSDLVPTTRLDDLRGKYRIAREDYETYGLWIGAGDEPDLTAPPVATFATRPYTTSLGLSGPGTYYSVVRWRNKWGLWSQNMTTKALPMLVDGEQGFVAPHGPSAVAITQSGNNYPIFSARYEPSQDVILADLTRNDPGRAEIFVLWYTRDDSTPDPGDTPSAYGLMGTRAGVETLKYTATGTAFLDETPVKALVRTRRLAIGAGQAFSPDTTQLPASGAGTIVVDSELVGWETTGYMKIATFSGTLQEVVEYSNLVIGLGISTFTVGSGGRGLWGTTATATVANNVIYPITPVDSENTDVTEYTIDGIAPGRPWGELLFGTDGAQEQEPIAGPDGATEEYISVPNDHYLLLGEGWCELWMGSDLVWKVFQDGNAANLNGLYIPSEWTVATGSVSGASTGVFDSVSNTSLYVVAGLTRRVHINSSAMTITVPSFSSLGGLPEAAPQSSTWEQYTGTLLQSWDPEKQDYRPYAQLTTAGLLTSQWTVYNDLTQAEIVAL